MSDIQKPSHSGIFEAQALENRAFDKTLGIHQEKISSLETVSSDLEQRMRVVEKFHYKYATITFIIGVISMAFIQVLIRKYII